MSPARAQRSEQIALWCAALVAAAVIWIPRYPPMIDLPQHAGEIRLLHDWFADDFPWRRQLELHWFTPYLTGYVAGALLTIVMPAVFATKLVWSLAMLGTLYTTQRLRRLLGADPRWDWLVLPGLFGTTFLWGLLPFMVSVPLALATLERWLRYLRAPTLRGALLLVALFAGMFFSHVLATAWLLTVAAIALLGTAITARWRWPLVPLRGLPLLAPLPLVYHWWHTPMVTTAPTGPAEFAWDFGWNRVTELFPQLLGITGSSVAIAVGALLYALPFVCGARLARSAVALAPLAVTAVILAVIPNILFGNAFTYNRFFTLLGPSLVLALAAPPAAPRLARLRLLVPVLAVGWIALMGVRMTLFGAEADDFAELVARMPAEQRTLGIVLARRSYAADVSRAYLHFPVWYQAEGGGLTDYSFATLAPSVVRLRASYTPPIPPGFEFGPTFDWEKNRGWEFDAILVRTPPDGDTKPPLANPRLRLVDHAGTWWRYAPVDRGGAAP